MYEILSTFITAKTKLLNCIIGDSLLHNELHILVNIDIYVVSGA